METTRRTFVAGTAAAGIALATAGTAFAEEAKTEEAAAETDGDGYSVVETESGLQVTIADDENPRPAHRRRARHGRHHRRNRRGRQDHGLLRRPA